MAPEPFLITTLKEVVRALNEWRTDYALAGGLAYSALVEPRATTDVDVLILLEATNSDQIARLFSGVFDSVVPHQAPMLFKGGSIWRVIGIKDEREVIVDLLLAHSAFHRQALARKRTVDFEGLALPIVTLEDLILLKAMAGRLQDLADIERICQRPDLQVDWSYVEVWRDKLGLPAIRP
ncbi:MAG: nucleotidyltransferase [Nitrospirota bacterium]